MAGLAALGLKAVEGGVEDTSKLRLSSKTEHLTTMFLSNSKKISLHSEIRFSICNGQHSVAINSFQIS
jgi:hypothetical protein